MNEPCHDRYVKYEKANMDHILVMPMHDPRGKLFPHLERITPALKEVFSGAVISVAPGEGARLLADAFYRTVTVATDLPVGAHFRALYQHASETCPPASALHLCFADRLAFQMEGGFRQDFFASIRTVQRDALPLIFQRSAAAWATHPSNYREIEAAIYMVGRWVFGRALDFAWCHLAVEARTLGKILPAVHRTDMSMMAEIVVQLIKEIKTEDVDWLAWEDPFILGRQPDELMREREDSLEETRKRLSYALPMMEVIKQGAF
jgi:hypothetical protein